MIPPPCKIGLTDVWLFSLHYLGFLLILWLITLEKVYKPNKIKTLIRIPSDAKEKQLKALKNSSVCQPEKYFWKRFIPFKSKERNSRSSYRRNCLLVKWIDLSKVLMLISFIVSWLIGNFDCGFNSRKNNNVKWY